MYVYSHIHAYIHIYKEGEVAYVLGCNIGVNEFELRSRYYIHSYSSERYGPYWTSPGDSTPQSSSCTATNPPSRKLAKLDEPTMQDTAVKVGTSS